MKNDKVFQYIGAFIMGAISEDDTVDVSVQENMQGDGVIISVTLGLFEDDHEMIYALLRNMEHPAEVGYRVGEETVQDIEVSRAAADGRCV